MRMVSTGSPPVPMPIQVPPGHVLHQIVDERGTLRHVILSPAPAAAAAAAAGPSPAAGAVGVLPLATPTHPPPPPPHYVSIDHLGGNTDAFLSVPRNPSHISLFLFEASSFFRFISPPRFERHSFELTYHT